MVFRLFLLLWLFCGLNEVNASDNPAITVILIDVSKSMVGKGDGNGIDIFSDVKAVANKIVERSRPGQRLMVLPFGKGVLKEVLQIVTSDMAARERAIQHLGSLQASEDQTWLTSSYEVALKQIDSIRLKDPSVRDSLIEVLILTDGKGNGPQDDNIENFIRLHELKKSDYPHLLTTFLTVGKIFSQKDVIKLEDAGVSVKRTQRDEISSVLTVSVTPTHVVLHSSAPSFELSFTFDQPAGGTPVKASVISLTADSSGSLFEVSPKEFALNQRQEFTLSAVNLESLKRWMLERGRTSVNCTVKLEATNVLFFPTAELPVQFNVEPVQIRVKCQAELIKNGYGDIEVEFESSTKEKKLVRADLSALGLGKLQFKISPQEFEIHDHGSAKIQIMPRDPKEIREMRKSLNSSVNGQFQLSFTSAAPYTVFDHPLVSIPVTLGPDCFERWKGLIIGTASLLMVILLALVYLIARTARFPKRAKLQRADGSTVLLKAQMGRRCVILGNGKDVQVSCPGLGVKGRLVEIRRKAHGLLLKRTSDQISLLSDAGTPAGQLELQADEHFSLKDTLGNTETFKFIRY